MKIKAGIVGGAGYTAGELLRLLTLHPDVEVTMVHSTSHAGDRVGNVHTGLEDSELVFTDEFRADGLDVLFICSAHGQSSKFLAENELPTELKVIDLAQDFRDETGGFVYGLPELQKERISKANRIANPGCFATAIQLSLLPLAAAGLLPDEVHITGVTGSTGAGVKPAPTTHFSWRSDNLSVYKAFGHQHIAEIRRSLTKLQPAFRGALNFVPVRGNFARGIFIMAYVKSAVSEEEGYALFNDYYKGQPFVSVSRKPIDMKQAVNTNRARLALEKHGDNLLITCAIDNLLKGASGQAVQNMNLMFGLPETMGLELKPSAF